MTLSADVLRYRVAAYTARVGDAHPENVSDGEWAALLLAESPDPQWRVMRSQVGGISGVRRALREAWSWEVADAYTGPTRPGGAVKTLLTPNGRCGWCDRRLQGGHLTFCGTDCRRWYARRSARDGKARVCRTHGCAVEMPEDYSDAYCPACQDARAMARRDADDERYDRPCKTDGCENVTAWEGVGRPPSYCVDCMDSTRRARDRKRRQRARQAGA